MPKQTIPPHAIRVVKNIFRDFSLYYVTAQSMVIWAPFWSQIVQHQLPDISVSSLTYIDLSIFTHFKNWITPKFGQIVLWKRQKSQLIYRAMPFDAHPAVPCNVLKDESCTLWYRKGICTFCDLSNNLVLLFYIYSTAEVKTPIGSCAFFKVYLQVRDYNSVQ